jgi:hypothetical protein
MTTRLTAQMPFVIKTLACHPDRRAAKTDTEERRIRDADHGFRAAGWAYLPFVRVEPFEEVDVPHADNSTTPPRSQQWAERHSGSLSALEGIEAAVNYAVRLATGDTVTLATDEVGVLFDELWRLSRRGAVAAALKLHDARRRPNQVRLVRLDDYETSAFVEALSRLNLDSA